ncbi:MAG: FGGY-family carbohydrate kinase [Treponema sp.]|nr:FGGY-family carbohydrate kinase [Treponema sp.]
MILSLECSTSSAKALLYDPVLSEIVRVKSEAYPHQVSAFGGVLGTQDTSAVAALAIRLGKEVASEAENIEAIALGGTFHSIVVCTGSMEPLTPTFTWMYPGAHALTAELRKNERYTHDYYHRTGCMVHTLYPAFQLMKLRDEGFDFAGTKIASQSGFLFYTLTGVHLETASTNSGGGLINLREKSWDPETLADIGLSLANVAELVNYRDVLPLSPSGAALLGLKSGIPVLPSYPDGALNQVGSGALDHGIMTFSMGTSGALRLSVDEPLVPEHPSTWCYLSPVSWMSGAAVSGACDCVDWIKAALFPSLSFDDIEKSQAVDYRNMPYFLPFLFGERCPGWDDNRTGGFFGMRSYHTPLDIYYSVLEGILFSLYQCYELLCQTAQTPSIIKLSGGILNSPRWKQMCADVFNCRMSCEKIPHASLLGGVVLALEHTGYLDDIKNYMVKSGETIQPGGEGSAIFAERYQNYLLYYNAQL